ncbi:chondroitinase-AC-like [Oratosquilla oratoria]|uniref:chondroitinase-AC-like n=1 Tax=Oratosquilla oratoria TaxID=337810 RepID=UPI003F774699
MDEHLMQIFLVFISILTTSTASGWTSKGSRSQEDDQQEDPDSASFPSSRWEVEVPQGTGSGVVAGPLWGGGRYEKALKEALGVVEDRVEAWALKIGSHQSSAYILNLMQDDGSFKDLKYEESLAEGSKAFQRHGRRAGALVIHLLEGEDLYDKILLTYKYIVYSAPENMDLNWWGHVVGTPQLMWEGVFLGRKRLPTQLLRDLLDRYWVKTPFGPCWNFEKQDETMAGGNLGNRALLAEVEALVEEELKRRGEGTGPEELRLPGRNFDARHAQVRERLHTELVERDGFDGNGFRRDGCLHQHNIKGGGSTQHHYYLNYTLQHIYNNNYGKEFLRDVSAVVSFVHGTPWGLSPADEAAMYGALLDCQQWLYRGETAEPTSTGRFITSNYMVTKDATRVAVLLTGENLLKLGDVERNRAVSAAMDRVRDPLAEGAALVGNRHFFNSDLMAHQRTSFSAMLRILSNRTSRPETWPTQNAHGYFQGDGVLTVLVDGHELGKRGSEVLFVYDWARIPGVTCQYTHKIPVFHTARYWSEHAFNNETFVGGASDEVVGVAAMVYGRPAVPLKARMSWNFFDDVIVALGTDITLEASRTSLESVTTTLAQLVLEGDVTVGLSDGQQLVLEQLGNWSFSHPKWLHHRNIGYVILDGHEDVKIAAEERTRDDVSIRVFSAWLDHGPSPSRARYSYAIVPAVDVRTTATFAREPKVRVLQQDSKMHAVTHAPSQTTMVSFFEAGQVLLDTNSDSVVPGAALTVSAPCLAIATLAPRQLTLTLSDPQGLHDVVVVSFDHEGGHADTRVDLPGGERRGSSVTTVIEW